MPKELGLKNSSRPSNSIQEKRVHALQAWFEKQARSLPWRLDLAESETLTGRRQERFLYRVWLSEIMLQQTQVATVIPYFQKFTRRFPTVRDLAQASIDEVYQLWAGLGYYSRARNLHRGAQAIAARLEAGQGFPKSRAEWLAIPGVGPYTSGAICSIGLNQREPIVDGNVVRVLSRWHQISKIDSKLTAIWKLADELVQVPSAKPAILNQALMELGATVCRPKNPNCEECPVARQCGGRNAWERFPPKKVRAEVVAISEVRHVTIAQVKPVHVLLSQNEGTRWRKGLWDFLTAPAALPLVKVREWKQSYQVTKHKVTRDHVLWEFRGNTLPVVSGAQWWPLDQLPGVPAPVKKALLQLMSKNSS